MARSRSTEAPPKRLILDSGAVIALSRDDHRAAAVVRAAWESGIEVSIPAVVVAETVRGGAKDAPVDRVVKSVGNILPVDEGVGRVAGALLGRARSSSTIDALVVAHALGIGGALILTGDPHDLGALADGHPEVLVQPL